MITAMLMALATAGATPAPQAAAATEVVVEDWTPSMFACGERKMLLRFGAVRETPVVIVDTGEGPHTLSALPWRSGDEVKLRWSDGQRSLTWSPGVQLMYMDGETHLMCGRMGHAHQH